MSSNTSVNYLTKHPNCSISSSTPAHLDTQPKAIPLEWHKQLDEHSIIDEEIIDFVLKQSISCMESPDKKRRIDCHNLLEEYNNSDEDDFSDSSDEEGIENRKKEKKRIAAITQNKTDIDILNESTVKRIKDEQNGIDEWQNEIIEQYALELSKKELNSNTKKDIDELSTKYVTENTKSGKIKKI